MDSLVKSRPNHYELLGLTPAASDEEISRAFAREIGPLRPRPFGSLARLSVAHETLRDPARRRAYDDSLGLARKPAPAKALQGWHYAGQVRVSRPGQPAPQPEAEPRAEPEPRPFAAESQVRPVPPRPAQTRPAPTPAPQRGWAPAGPVPLQRILPLDEESAEWKWPAVLGGGIFLGVGVMGVLAGLWASREVRSSVPETPFSIAAPAEAHAATPAPTAEAESAPAPVAARTVPHERVEHPAAARAVHPKRSSAPPEPALSKEQQADDVPEIPTAQVAALASGAAEAPAAMPLSDSVVARTIGRIGYDCGEVGSMTALDGAPGVFKVTCTSGQSFKATPVNGRYHFRRWAP